MRYFVLANETTVAEIAGKAFRNLPAPARRKAEEALIRENPELKSIAKLRAGALLRIPESIDAVTLDRASVVDPVDYLIEDVAGQLKALEAEVSSSHEARMLELEDHAAVLKAAGRDTQSRPEVRDMAVELTRNLRTSARNMEKNREMALEALKGLQEVAAALSKR